jgi:aspartyl-tRNA(Asn)/glutamyl-tRNA(Gln) amidotransferase subunit A
MSFTGLARKCLSNQSRYASLNAFTALPGNTRAVIEQAEKAQDAPPDRHTGVFGHLIAIKDNICTADFPTTAASGILSKFTSPYDATVVKKLRDAGAIIAGKTNMDEFGMGSHSIHSFFGPVRQTGTKGEDLSAGGSSGGSAVAVATEQCYAYELYSMEN